MKPSCGWIAASGQYPQITVVKIFDRRKTPQDVQGLVLYLENPSFAKVVRCGIGRVHWPCVRGVPLARDICARSIDAGEKICEEFSMYLIGKYLKWSTDRGLTMPLHQEHDSLPDVRSINPHQSFHVVNIASSHL